ncbi:hypothetical protein ACH5RR_017456 [Cinchona calisaya]|uniref:Thymidine kinase n=1 Tax=Cinchona calisaya TaxID=153742 RepID=A0ABD2ZLJ7_9GENT
MPDHRKVHLEVDQVSNSTSDAVICLADVCLGIIYSPKRLALYYGQCAVFLVFDFMVGLSFGQFLGSFYHQSSIYGSINGICLPNVAVIKSDKDTRYAFDSIVTHDGEKLPCWPLADLSSFRQKLGNEAYDKLEVIGIDEAQFFEDLYDFCCKAADHDGKTVIVAGLDGDYLRRSFGSVLEIIPLADSVTKLNARCELCGKRAFFTLRKTDETRTELIAGAEVYMPVCRNHYVSGQVIKEATKTVLESHKVQCCNAVL